MPSNIQGEKEMFVIQLNNDAENTVPVWFAVDEQSGAPYWTKKYENAKNFPDRDEVIATAKAIADADIGDPFGPTTCEPALLQLGLCLTASLLRGTGNLSVQKVRTSEIRQFSVRAEIIPQADFIPTAKLGGVRTVYAVCYINEAISGNRLYTKRDFQTVINASLQDRASIVMHCRRQFEVAMKEEIRNSPELQAKMRGKVLRYYADLLPNFHQPQLPEIVVGETEMMA
jgi:hypothetical protein